MAYIYHIIHYFEFLCGTFFKWYSNFILEGKTKYEDNTVNFFWVLKLMKMYTMRFDFKWTNLIGNQTHAPWVDDLHLTQKTWKLHIFILSFYIIHFINTISIFTLHLSGLLLQSFASHFSLSTSKLRKFYLASIACNSLKKSWCLKSSEKNRFS
jgi:hypothetical protein